MLTAWFLAVASAAVAAHPALKVTPVLYALQGDTIVGSVRAGMLCLPNGRLRWNDLRVPGKLDGQALIASALAREGVTVAATELDPAASTVSLSIESVRLRLCMPGMPRVAGKPKGEGSIGLRWWMQGADDKPVGAPFMIELPLTVTGEDPRRSSAMIERAIAESAHDFVLHWRKEQPSPLP